MIYEGPPASEGVPSGSAPSVVPSGGAPSGGAPSAVTGGPWAPMWRCSMSGGGVGGVSSLHCFLVGMCNCKGKI